MTSGTSTGSAGSKIGSILGILAAIALGATALSFFNSNDEPKDRDPREHVLTLWVEWRPNDDIPVVVTHTIRGRTTGPEDYFDSPLVISDTFQEGDQVNLKVEEQEGRELLDCIIMINDEPVARETRENTHVGCDITHTGWVPLAGWESMT